MALFFALAAPKAVFAMRTRKLATGFEHWTLQTHCTSLLFTTMAGLGTLS
jgi:hypothetical protein